MKLTKLFILATLFITEMLNAQSDFRPGYIIKITGDTVYGQIDYRGDLLMSNTCRFKDKNNTVIKYSPNDINAFRFIDNKYFISKDIDNEKVFLEYLINGKINIYYMRDDKGDHYYIDKEGERLSEIPYEEGIKRIGDKDVFYESTRHIGMISLYMQDAPEFQSRIQMLGKPEHNNLIKLAEKYHNTVCTGEECIIYEKKQPFFKVNFEMVVGVKNYIQKDYSIGEYYFTTGVIAHFWMPRVNEKLYFKTGVIYSQVEGDNEGLSYHIKIPTHIEYFAPNSYLIRPHISVGLMSPSYSGGIAIKINNMINIGFQGWANFDFEVAPWIPTELDNYSLLGSIYIDM